MPLYTGIVGRPAGQIVPLVSTTKRSKQVALTVTSGQAGWSASGSNAVFYCDSVGTWRLIFNISATFTGANLSSVSCTLAGVTSKGISAVSALFGGPWSGTFAVQQAYINGSTVTVAYNTLPTGNVTSMWISGDVELNAEPTWSAMGYTWAQIAETPGDTYAYIPNADGQTAGLLTPGAQTIGGPKSFTGRMTRSANSYVLAYTAAQNTAVSTWTTIQFASATTDINGEMGTTTGKFTPTVSGIYLATLTVRIDSLAVGKIFTIGLFKNNTAGAAGLIAKTLFDAENAAGVNIVLNCSGIVSLNGSGDYLWAGHFCNDSSRAFAPAESCITVAQL